MGHPIQTRRGTRSGGPPVHGRRMTHQHVHRLADPGSRAMQQDPLIFRTDGQEAANFIGFPALLVTQNNDRALTRWQGFDDIAHMIPKLPSADNPFRVEFIP